MYIQKMVEWHTGRGTEHQLRELLVGFHEIIPMKKIQVFTPTELESLMCGKQRINVDEMRVCTQYTGGYEDASGPINHFWSAFAKLNDDQRREVVRFATGSSRVPLDGFEPCFTITKSELGEEALPSPLRDGRGKKKKTKTKTKRRRRGRIVLVWAAGTSVPTPPHPVLSRPLLTFFLMFVCHRCAHLLQPARSPRVLERGEARGEASVCGVEREWLSPLVNGRGVVMIGRWMAGGDVLGGQDGEVCMIMMMG